jgi:hypothetical protein
MHDDDYDWADDETLNYDETMKIIDALGPDVEITGPPEGAEIPPQFRQTAALTSAYVTHTTTFPQRSYAFASDPTACPTG